jgi:hypothetical protein
MPMAPRTMRSEGAAALSRPRARAGTKAGRAKAPPAAAAPFRTSRRETVRPAREVVLMGSSSGLRRPTTAPAYPGVEGAAMNDPAKEMDKPAGGPYHAGAGGASAAEGDRPRFTSDNASPDIREPGGPCCWPRRGSGTCDRHQLGDASAFAQELLGRLRRAGPIPRHGAFSRGENNDDNGNGGIKGKKTTAKETAQDNNWED